MDQAQAWLVMGLIFGILMIWFGILSAIVSMPMAKGQVRSRDYNYRPFRPLFQKWLGITDEMEDRVGRQGAKWMIAYSIFMIALGFCAIIFGLTSLGNPLILYILAIVVLAALMIGIYVYTIAIARRKRA